MTEEAAWMLEQSLAPPAPLSQQTAQNIEQFGRLVDHVKNRVSP
jgi:hypothetical protein